jgi:hypothetical protein
VIYLRISDVQLDDQAVTTPLRAAGSRFLRVVGFETMREAQRSIVPGRGPSAPGSPPHDQTGVLRRFIRYAAQPDGKLVVIGPEYLPRKSEDAPRALEYGGTSINARGDAIHVAQRAFMRPAFGRVIPRVLPQLADSV